MVRTEQFADGAVVVVVAVEKYNNNLDNLIFCARYFNLKKLNREQ